MAAKTISEGTPGRHRVPGFLLFRVLVLALTAALAVAEAPRPARAEEPTATEEAEEAEVEGTEADGELAEDEEEGAPEGEAPKKKRKAAKKPAPPERVSPDQAKSLLAEFQKAQGSAWAALTHRQKLESAELTSAQQARRQEWELVARQEKQEYFAREKDAASRKQYVDQMQTKRQALQQTLDDERKNRDKEFEAQRQGLKESQAKNLAEFRKHLKKGQQPPRELWPPRGR